MAIFVYKSLNIKVIDAMTTVADNVLECLTIEVCREKNKNIIVSCIYRAPDSKIETFKEWMEGMFSNKSNKTIFIFQY